MTSVITGPHGPATPDLIAFLQGIFGKSYSVSRGYSAEHDGIDLPAKVGTPVYAITSGVVYYARDARLEKDRGLSGWAKYGGKVVDIDVGGGLRTQFAHLNSISVKEGQYVKAGQQIGTVGHTGGTPDSATASFVGPHVHFGLWDVKANKMINPTSYLEAIGDTTGNTWYQNASKFLQQAGISSSDPTHVFTSDETDRLIKALYGVSSGVVYDTAKKTFTGKTVGEYLNNQVQQADDGFLGIPGALTHIGQQLTDTLTWIGFILLGLVLIGGGIYLMRPNTVIKESS